jgi:hypothetical protein
MNGQALTSGAVNGNYDRFEWTEMRETAGARETFFVVAEDTRDGWQFSDRSAWESRYYDLEQDKGLIAIAEHAKRLVAAKGPPAKNGEDCKPITLADELRIGSLDPDFLNVRARWNRKYVAHLRAGWRSAKPDPQVQ